MRSVAVGLVWVIAVLALLSGVLSLSSPESHAQNEQTQGSPSAENAHRQNIEAKEGGNESYGWRKYKEKIERNEKFITATSTVFIAAFTVLLAFATFFLWSATRDLVEDAKHSGQENSRNMQASIAEFKRTAEAGTQAAQAALAQSIAADKQVAVMQSQLEEIKRQSVTAERSASAGRAYVFVRYKTPQSPAIFSLPGLADYFNVKVEFSVANFGQSPAIITKIDAHLLIGKDGRPLSDPPDLQSVGTAELFETRRDMIVQTSFTPDRGLMMPKGLDDAGSGDTRIFVPAGAENIEIEQTFWFEGRTKPRLRSAHGAWFLCNITYADIFGIERHTRYFVGITGAAFRYSNNPSDNSWD